MRLHLSQYHIVLYWYYLPYHLWLQMLLSTHTEPLFGKKIMGWVLSCLSETLKISVALHQFQAQSLSHFLQWWRGLGHFLWMKRLFSRMNKCLCDDRDLHRGFSQVGQSMTAAESWFSTQSSLERWACRSSGPQNHPQVHYLPVLFVWGDFLQKINIKLIMKQTALNGVSAYRMTMSFQYFTVISSWSGPDSDKIEKIVLPRLEAIKIKTQYKEKERPEAVFKELANKNKSERDLNIALKMIPHITREKTYTKI